MNISVYHSSLLVSNTSVQLYSHLPRLRSPSCLQMTFPSLLSQPLSHIVPQAWFIHTSTLPSWLPEPPTNLTFPSLQLAGFVVIPSYNHKQILQIMVLRNTFLLTLANNTSIIIWSTVVQVGNTMMAWSNVGLCSIAVDLCNTKRKLSFTIIWSH